MRFGMSKMRRRSRRIHLVSRKWIGTLWECIRVPLRFRYLGSTPRDGEVRKVKFRRLLRRDFFQ